MANDIPSYKLIWKWFSEDEQNQICLQYILFTKSEDAPDWLHDWLIKQLAGKLAFRPQTLKKYNDNKLAIELRKFAVDILDTNDWRVSYLLYYMGFQQDNMCSFLDEMGIKHDERGSVTEMPSTLDDAVIASAISVLRKTWSAREIARYFTVLMHMDENWAPLGSHLASLLVQASDDEAGAETRPRVVSEPAKEQVDDTARISDEFTTLDRVIIEHIISTTSETEGALNSNQLDDLIGTITSLNASWHRAYFHQGFKDTLLPDSSPDFDRPEFNDTRREWYLAGVLTAHARRRDSEAIREVFSQHAEIFRRAASKPGGAGATVARNLFSVLVEIGQISEASSLLDGQFDVLGNRIAGSALQHASNLLRINDIASADVLLRILCEKLSNLDEDNHDFDDLKRLVNRKFGQCQQAKGDFKDAADIFEKLIAEEETPAAELLADLGLVKCGFRSLDEVRLPEAEERRASMKQELEKGESELRKAVELHGVEATNANYALGVLNFLRFRDPGNSADSEKARDDALGYIQNALTGMLRSKAKDAYQAMGVIGRCRFMQAVTQISRLNPSDLHTVMTAWKEITQETGKLPIQDIRLLLENMELIDEKSAIEIAESIWRYRQKDALEIISGSMWFAKSTYIRNEILREAENEDNPRQVRWSLLASLVPALIENGQKQEAENCLDTIEQLSLEPEIARYYLDWLDDEGNYDPIWSAVEVLRQKLRIARLLGDDAQAYASLVNLFYAVRDSDPMEAEQIIQLFKDLGAPEEQYSSLTLPADENTLKNTDIEQLLASGEEITVLFVGGNETQKQYDERIANSLTQKWPGVSVKFEHTGWSSNWGREVDRIMNVARESDVVVLMSMMRTLLGRTLRERLNDPGVPWVPCTGTGRVAMQRSIEKAVYVAMDNRKQ